MKIKRGVPEAGDSTWNKYTCMLQVVKDSGFQGHVGIEFEGLNLGERRHTRYEGFIGKTLAW
ncbi:MAG: hypothetical protein IPK96_20810 [Flammeovirgaceae bacterium]|nr:hypothetical protein [Flammeovirgaceae bacterium]